MNKKTIFVFIGKAQNGKDTSANLLKKYIPDLQMTPFAKLLKDQAKMLGWDGVKDDAGRSFLQHLGDVLKEYHGKDYFVRETLKNIDESDWQFFAITDCRFKEEIRMLNELDDEKYNVKYYHVVRPQDGTWSDGLTEAQRHHISETDLDYVAKFMPELLNDGTIEQLSKKIEKIVEEDCDIAEDYFFTFGSDTGFPYQSGYVKVRARNEDRAVEGFRKKYPDRPGSGLVNCAFIYSQHDDYLTIEKIAKNEKMNDLIVSI